MTLQSLTGIVTDGPLLIAALVAAVAGAVSFLSPCCLPLLPGYLAYVTGAGGAEMNAPETSRRSVAVVGTALFVLGFAAVFTAYGALFGTLGQLVVANQDVVLRVLGAFTIVLGLVFAGVLDAVPGLSRTVRIDYRPRVGLVGAPVLGVMFGIGWTPCIGPTLAAVLSLSTTSGTAGRGAALSFAYSLGLGIPFLFAALGISQAFRVFEFARRHAKAVMRTGGAMLVILGVLEVVGLWTELLSRLQVLLGTWQAPL